VLENVFGELRHDVVPQPVYLSRPRRFEHASSRRARGRGLASERARPRLILFTRSSNAEFFLGPKDFEHLKAVDPDLTYAIDFGVFRWFVVPLLDALKWINKYAMRKEFRRKRR
jgi:hypothetical protein